jgi:hypothetical protein
MITICLLVAAFLSGSLEAAEQGKPHVVVSSPEYEAGSVWEGDTISHQFMVKNTGEADLRILTVKSG